MPVVYLPSRYIVSPGQITRKMWFLKHGHVELIFQGPRVYETVWQGGAGRDGMGCTPFEPHPSVQHIATLLETPFAGAYPHPVHPVPPTPQRLTHGGVMGLFVGKEHMLAIRTLGYVDGYTLNRVDFERVIVDFPGSAMKLSEQAFLCLEPPNARIVARRLYSLLGMGSVRGRLLNLMRWRPTKGFSQRLRGLAHRMKERPFEYRKTPLAACASRLSKAVAVSADKKLAICIPVDLSRTPLHNGVSGAKSARGKPRTPLIPLRSARAANPVLSARGDARKKSCGRAGGSRGNELVDMLSGLQEALEALEERDSAHQLAQQQAHRALSDQMAELRQLLQTAGGKHDTLDLETGLLIGEGAVEGGEGGNAERVAELMATFEGVSKEPPPSARRSTSGCSASYCSSTPTLTPHSTLSSASAHTTLNIAADEGSSIFAQWHAHLTC